MEVRYIFLIIQPLSFFIINNYIYSSFPIFQLTQTWKINYALCYKLNITELIAMVMSAEVTGSYSTTYPLFYEVGYGEARELAEALFVNNGL